MRKLSAGMAGLVALVVMAGGGGYAGSEDSIGRMLNGHRPPAVPLVVHDPYFSVWSESDHLNSDWPRHWTGHVQSMCSMIRVDGKTFRLMGTEPRGAKTMNQVAREVWPTRTVYRFQNPKVGVELVFTSPELSYDLDVLSRPLTYITWTVTSRDGAAHKVSVYFDATAEMAVNDPSQKVSWSRLKVDDLHVMQVGTVEQPVLGQKGDDVRIDWGQFLVSVPESFDTVIARDRIVRKRFATEGRIPTADDTDMPRAASNRWPVLAAAADLPEVKANGPVSAHLSVAYDDKYSIEYLQRRLKGYWHVSIPDASALLSQAEKDYPALEKNCESFDEELMKDLVSVGGNDFAYLGALSYRQCLGANKVVEDFDGSPLMFPKENFSNGCIGTVDVIYPASPIFMALNPDMLKAQLKPVLEYAASARWRFPFSPHDLGTYPLADGQVYGGGEKTEENQMPVEETGNMLIMMGMLARQDGNADFAKPYWKMLASWAQYLKEKGMDPENQLCTDDFAGHLAHNANLSIKAIMGIGAYSVLLDKAGQADEAAKWKDTARTMAKQWIEKDADGDHFRLTFDRPGTWSQKYNLVWDKLLGLNLFPDSVATKEMAYYQTKLQSFGLPLDSRKTYTKLDWTVWTSCLADKRPDADRLMGLLVKYADQTPDRVPLGDWYETTNAKKVGFQARSVVGGVFLPLLYHPEIVSKWTSRAEKTKNESARKAKGEPGDD